MNKCRRLPENRLLDCNQAASSFFTIIRLVKQAASINPSKNLTLSTLTFATIAIHK